MRVLLTVVPALSRKPKKSGKSRAPKEQVAIADSLIELGLTNEDDGEFQEVVQTNMPAVPESSEQLENDSSEDDDGDDRLVPSDPQ